MINLAKLTVFSSLFSFILTLPIFSQGFNSISSKDGIDVIAVGQGGSVFRSWTGGASWGSYPLGANNLISVQSMVNNIWIVGDNGTLYYTVNNGGNWSNQTLAGGIKLNSVYFFDANTGWIVGNNGTILKSTNSGTNWTTQTSPVTNNLRSVRFTTVLSGVACSEGGKIIHTTNGGTSWVQYSTSITNDLLSIDQKANTIIAGGSNSFVYKSTDNGTTWNSIDYHIASKSDITSIYMFDANTYYSCGGGGFIRKSTDGGTSFTFQINPMMADLASVYFFDAQKGWAVSSLNQAIIYTTDGGSTWSFPPGTSVTYSWQLKQSGSGNIGNGFCLHPTNKNEIFIAMGNQIYRSLNRGETWTQIATITVGTQNHSFYVNPNDTNLMLASMNSSGGRVVRSTDYGLTWTTTWGPGTLTSYGMPLEMDPNNPNICYLGPDNSIMLKSTDFGATWTNWSTFTFRSPCDLAVLFGHPNIIYVGDGTTGSGSGELLKSTNGGINWTSVHTVSGSEMPMLAVSNLDSNIAYHTCWSSGGFWRTTNQWTTFTQVNTAGSAWGTDIAKDDPNVVAFGIYGTTSAYISTNGGNNFITTSTLPGPNYGVLYYDRGTLLTQEGGGVYKMTVTYSVITANSPISSLIPEKFELSQNYPNPFNPSTKIEYNVSRQSNIQIKVFDILGNEVKSVVNNYLAPGRYSAVFDASNLSSGIYFYTMLSDGQKIDSRKMMLIK